VTGYMYALGRCWSCGRPLMFNAERVPSIPIDGERQPICQGCVDIANPRRVANGLDPIVVMPGAYEPSETL